MSIGISAEHQELASSLRSWAASVRGVECARAAEDDAAASFDEVWKAAVEMGVPTIGLPEAAGGGGGTPLDVAVALEACTHELVPGALLSTSVAAALLGEDPEVAPRLAAGARAALALRPDLVVVADLPGADLVLLPDHDGGWHVVPADRLPGRPGQRVDLTRRHASVTTAPAELSAALAAGRALPHLDSAAVRRAWVTYAAAEASGVARWCLSTAVAYAKVREQFGKPIGSFQAVKHLCAEMLETAEAVTAAAWDAAAVAFADDQQWAFATDVAAATCFTGAVEVAKTAIQVLGGIGFTYEHDAHLYLRRALALQAQAASIGAGAEAAAARLTSAAVAGVRRRVEVDLDGRDAAVRDDVRSTVEAIAAVPEEHRRARLVEAGYLTPHWPAPYGVGADAVTQLVIDQELARAGVVRPDIVIAGWALPTIVQHGDDAQRERFVLPSLRGELVWCQLFSEPGSGSDLASLRTRATKVDGGWRLSGQKVWTSVADRADWGICLARTDPDVPQHQGIGYFLVDMRSPGIEVRPLREITGEALFNEVFLDDVLVPDDCLVAGPGDGWRLARTTLANERVAMATSKFDVSTERAVALVADPAREPVGGDATGERVAVGRSVARSSVCSLLGVRSTLRSLAGQGPGAESSVAKLLGVHSRQVGADLVVDLYGDRVLSDDDGAREALWEQLNTRCLSIAGGTTQILRNVAGERILGLPR